MINILEIQNQEINEIISDFHEKGGVLNITIYKIEENYLKQLPHDDYTAHLVVARQTIDRINYQCNFYWNKVASQNSRSDCPIFLTDYDKLDSSGVRLEVEEFLGSFYDLKTIYQAFRSFINYSKFSRTIEEESIENKVDFSQNSRSLQLINGGFVKAFLEPPYSMQLGNDIKLIGDYLIRFMDFFFGELDKIQVFTWSTDCSPFFEDGKEWWGCYFWTVYNPIKDWYVGIVASATD